MVDLVSLWLPILVSGVAVFFLSFLMWMVLPFHRKDWAALPDEDGTMAHLGDIAQGQYMFPHCDSPEGLKDPEFQRKQRDGPAGLLIVMARGPMKIGRHMAVSLLFNLMISLLTAYVATIALPGGTSGGTVLRLTSTVAFMAYSGALAWNAIWFHHGWKSTAMSMFDGLVYGVGTGIVFMFLWPA
jgi:hypothetical protein